jgi:excisionase family DNA binding protein
MNNNGDKVPPRPWTRREAADYLRRSERTIDRMIRDNELVAVHVGRSVLINPESIVSKVHPQK